MKASDLFRSGRAWVILAVVIVAAVGVSVLASSGRGEAPDVEAEAASSDDAVDTGRRVRYAEWSPDGEKIAAVIREGGSSHLKVISPTGDVLSELGIIPRDEIYWVPDGRSILFFDGPSIANVTEAREKAPLLYTLKSVDLATGDRRTVWSGLSAPRVDVSPTGNAVAGFKRESEDEVAEGLWILDLKTGEERRVSDGIDVIVPKWSPDASRIAFLGSPSKLDDPGDAWDYMFGQDLYICRDGECTRVVKAKEHPVRPGTFGWIGPNKVRFVVRDQTELEARNFEEGPTPKPGTGGFHIAQVDVESGEVTRLLEVNEAIGHEKHFHVLRAVWATDGAGLLLLEFKKSDDEHRQAVYWITPDGRIGGEVAAGKTLYPFLAPDGRKALILKDGDLGIWGRGDKHVNWLGLIQPKKSDNALSAADIKEGYQQVLDLYSKNRPQEAAELAKDLASSPLRFEVSWEDEPEEYFSAFIPERLMPTLALMRNVGRKNVEYADSLRTDGKTAQAYDVLQINLAMVRQIVDSEPHSSIAIINGLNLWKTTMVLLQAHVVATGDTDKAEAIQRCTSKSMEFSENALAPTIESAEEWEKRMEEALENTPEAEREEKATDLVRQAIRRDQDTAARLAKQWHEEVEAPCKPTLAGLPGVGSDE